MNLTKQLSREKTITQMEKKEQEQQPHILILPFPVQGHIKPMLYLAELLCHTGLRVTFINTDYNHRRLINDLRFLSTQFSTLHFESISDGLPQDCPRDLQTFPELIITLKNVTKPLFRDLLVSLCRDLDEGPPVTCIIFDGIMSCVAIDAAEELGINLIAFRAFSACCLWASFCVPKLVEEGLLPFEDDEMDQEIACVPGMEGFLRRRDLPSFCRVKQIDDPIFKFLLHETLSMTRASSLILNTFQDLETPILSHLASLFLKIYTIGPLHALLKSKTSNFLHSSSSNCNLWNVDRSCMAWLDSQSPKSVVYVSFGSLVTLTRGQIDEFWHGLVNSGKKFLWVIRLNTIEDGKEEENKKILKELEETTKERGLIVNWAPQEEVLGHQAVGAFFTHSGWNSTMESIVAGVPLICWPRLADQTVNSRWTSEVWRIGVDMKDVCDRSTVEKVVRAVMKDEREIMRSVERFAGLASDSVHKGGSSYNNLENLIEALKT